MEHKRIIQINENQGRLFYEDRKFCLRVYWDVYNLSGIKRKTKTPIEAVRLIGKIHKIESINDTFRIYKIGEKIINKIDEMELRRIIYNQNDTNNIN